MKILPFQVLLWALISLPSWAEELTETARSQIKEAERELLLAEASYRRASNRLQELQEDPATPTETLLAMETYVNELAELVEIREETLREVNSMAGNAMPAPDPTVLEGMESFEEAVGAVPDAEDAESEQERLDREFAASLDEFDGMILAYNRSLEDQIASRSAQGEAEASPHQTAAAEAEALLRSMGVDPGSGGEGSESEQTAGTDSADPTQGEQGNTPEVATNGATTESGEGSSVQGSSRPPREDEDVVARQLREAAEKETDPVLREKLWKEYEAYLDGRS